MSYLKTSKTTQAGQWSFAENGGSSSGGAINLGVALKSSNIITRFTVFVISPLTSAGLATVGFTLCDPATFFWYMMNPTGFATFNTAGDAYQGVDFNSNPLFAAVVGSLVGNIYLQIQVADLTGGILGFIIEYEEILSGLPS